MQCYIDGYVGVYVVVQYFDDFIYCFGVVGWLLGQFDYDYVVYLCVYYFFWWDQDIEVQVVVVWDDKVDVSVGEVMVNYLVGFWYEDVDDVCFVVVFMVCVQWLSQYLVVVNIGFYLF